MHVRSLRVISLTATLVIFVHFSVAMEPSLATDVAIGDTSIKLPILPGFVETSKRSPALWAQALATAAGDARPVAHFITKADLVLFEKGSDLSFREFAYVHTPKRAETLTASQQQFDKLRVGTIALQEDYARKIGPGLAKEIERTTNGLSKLRGESFNFKVGELVPVSIDKNTPAVLIYTVMSQLMDTEKGESGHQTMVMTTAYCFVKSKVVMLSYHRQFTSPRDLEASRTFVTRWSSALSSAN